MNILDSIKQNIIVPVNKEGHPFIAIAGGAFLLFFWLNSFLTWPTLVLLCWVIYFFRDPIRVTPLREGLVVSPADGRVSMIANVIPPPELGLGELPLLRISVFMNVFDCHVNRAPVTGIIVKHAYKPGLFLNAELDKASDENERNSIVIRHTSGDYGVVQIAGLVARRIKWWVQENQPISTGDRFGMIRFGSRVDVYCPEGVRALVAEGQTCIAGETVIADLSKNESSRSFKIA
jgi:phosphatidylserine decarboxylase